MLLLIIVGIVLAGAAIRSISGIVVFVLDMKKGGQHAPEILGAMTASILITLAVGWVWKKIYNSKKPAVESPKLQ